MKNIPKRIYLQIGDMTDKDDSNMMHKTVRID